MEECSGWYAGAAVLFEEFAEACTVTIAAGSAEIYELGHYAWCYFGIGRRLYFSDWYHYWEPRSRGGLIADRCVLRGGIRQEPDSGGVRNANGGYDQDPLAR